MPFPVDWPDHSSAQVVNIFSSHQASINLQEKQLSHQQHVVLKRHCIDSSCNSCFSNTCHKRHLHRGQANLHLSTNPLRLCSTRRYSSIRSLFCNSFWCSKSSRTMHHNHVSHWHNLFNPADCNKLSKWWRRRYCRCNRSRRRQLWNSNTSSLFIGDWSICWLPKQQYHCHLHRGHSWRLINCSNSSHFLRSSLSRLQHRLQDHRCSSLCWNPNQDWWKGCWHLQIAWNSSIASHSTLSNRNLSEPSLLRISICLWEDGRFKGGGSH